jgi:glycosyltransferase involved in cell wall biosynthesis
MRPRVLFVSRTRYRLPLDAQVARKWDALSDELDVRVLATGDDDDDGRFRLVRARSQAFYLRLPLHVARELRSFRPDVVVAQSPYETGAALVGRALARSRARVVAEVHGDWRTATRLYGSRGRRMVEPISRSVAVAALRRADAVRTLSPFTTGLVRRIGVEPTTAFTAYFDSSAFAVTPPAPLPDRPRALFVGVLERYKDVDGLAEAWRLAEARVPEASLHLIGKGRERRVAESLVRDFPGRVDWDEWVPSERVAAALDAATVLLLPSQSEGLPRIVIEAFARGRAVVGARAGGIPDIVEDGVSGLLVPPGDPGALADAIVRVLSDPALAQSLARGAHAAAAGWLQTPEEFAARVRELVDGVRG